MIFNDAQKIYLGGTQVNKIILQNQNIFTLTGSTTAILVAGSDVSQVNGLYSLSDGETANSYPVYRKGTAAVINRGSGPDAWYIGYGVLGIGIFPTNYEHYNTVIGDPWSGGTWLNVPFRGGGSVTVNLTTI